MKYNDIEINVLIKGKPITEYPHNGQVFVEGRDGSEFEVEVRNHSRTRVETVISVDGLSVIDGKDAGPTSAGYIIDANDSIRIPGWKLNDDQVAAFQFAGKRNAYATHVNGGDARNSGVIGILAFQEKQVRYHHMINTAFPSWSGAATTNTFSPSALRGMTISSNAAALGGAALGGAAYGAVGMNAMDTCMVSSSGMSPGISAREVDLSYSVGTAKGLAPVQQTLGTAFGEAQDFSTKTETFERADLQAMIVLYYDDARGLKARGIDLSRRSKRRETQQPVAFPGMACAPPAGWRG